MAIKLVLTERFQRLWFDPGPDHGWSWVIVVSSLFYSFVLQGIFKAQGYLFVATVETYGLSREEASWPFVIFFVTAHVSGVFAGLLSHYLSCRTIMFISSTLMCLGYAVCFAAPSNIVWMTVGYGIIAGPNLGITFASLLQIVNEYFENYRTTANQFLMSGLGLDGLIYPFFLYYLLSKYALKGTFLMLCAFNLHTFVAAALLRPRTAKHFPSLSQPEATSIAVIYSPTESTDFSGTVPPQDSKSKVITTETPRAPCSEKASYTALLRSLFGDPMFYIITLSSLFDIVAWGIFFMTVADYATDGGMSPELATMLLPVHSAAELATRLGTGWITDKGYVGIKVFHLASVLLTGVFFTLYPLARGNGLFFAFVSVLGCLYGTSTGSRLVLYVDYLDVNKMPTANGTLLFLAGVVFLGIPKLLGLLRDSLGSYDLIYVCQGVLCLASALAWLLEPGLLSKLCKKQLTKKESNVTSNIEQTKL